MDPGAVTRKRAVQDRCARPRTRHRPAGPSEAGGRGGLRPARRGPDDRTRHGGTGPACRVTGGCTWIARKRASRTCGVSRSAVVAAHSAPYGPARSEHAWARPPRGRDRLADRDLPSVPAIPGTGFSRPPGGEPRGERSRPRWRGPFRAAGLMRRRRRPTCLPYPFRPGRPAGPARPAHHRSPGGEVRTPPVDRDPVGRGAGRPYEGGRRPSCPRPWAESERSASSRNPMSSR